MAPEDESKSTSRPLPEMKLVLPPLEEKRTNIVSENRSTTVPQQQKRGVSSAEKLEPIAVDDKDLPSSTPAPPPLNIPIVTHSARPSEGMYVSESCYLKHDQWYVSCVFLAAQFKVCMMKECKQE